LANGAGVFKLLPEKVTLSPAANLAEAAVVIFALPVVTALLPLNVTAAGAAIETVGGVT
jgi:hypothetical protein